MASNRNHPCGGVLVGLARCLAPRLGARGGKRAQCCGRSHLKRAASTAVAPAAFCICSNRMRFCSAARRAASAAAASCFSFSRSDSASAPASWRCNTAAAVCARFIVAAALRALACADARRRMAASCSTLAVMFASFAARCSLKDSRRRSSCGHINTDRQFLAAGTICSPPTATAIDRTNNRAAKCVLRSFSRPIHMTQAQRCSRCACRSLAPPLFLAAVLLPGDPAAQPATSAR